MKKLITAITLASTIYITGCAHADVDSGFEVAQKGLAAADVAVDALVVKYTKSVIYLRSQCSLEVDPAVCEKRLYVDDDSVAKVRGVLQGISNQYDQTVESMKLTKTAWGSIESQVVYVVEVASGSN